MGENFVGSTSEVDEKSGLVPAPTTEDVGTVLFSDGLWHPVNFNMNYAPDSIENLSWDSDIPELARAVERNPRVYASLVGKEKTFTTEGLGTFTAICVDVAHFDKFDGSGKAGLTFQFKETTGSNYQMNIGSHNIDGYPGSQMYTDILPNVILTAMQGEVRDNIVEVVFPYNTYGGTGQGDSAYLISETHAKLFLPSNREVWGTNPLKDNGYTAEDTYLTGADGTQLAYWVQHPTVTDHVKYEVGTDTISTYWLRSCGWGTKLFCCIEGRGYAGAAEANNISVRVAPIFCIGG